MKKNPCTLNTQQYLDICNEFQIVTNSTFEEYNRKLEQNIKSNPKNFFSYVKTKLKSNSFPSCMHFNDSEGKNPREISNLFADFFQSVYTSFSDSDRDTSYFDYISVPAAFSSINSISRDEIHKIISNLDGSKGPGPDGIPPVLLKKLVNELVTPIFRLFNLSLQTGIFPEVWKESYLVPIHKSGKKSDVKNYRGIAILSCIPKLFEAIINEQLFVKVKHYISENQHGFFKGRSTTTNLLEFVTYTINAMDRGYSVQALYTDFSKAFDRIDIPMLILKLQKFGIESRLLKWIESYLTNRTQSVKLHNEISKRINVTSGVPQGSHLGPLLFIIYVNDISVLLKRLKVLIYADDMKLYMTIKDSNDDISFQEEVDIFIEWCSKSLLELNVKKCNNITFTRKRTISNQTISLGNQVVSKCNTIRDLGVILDSKLTFVDHYNCIIHKASNMLSFIKRFSYNFHDPYTLKTLYISYVRSILEYCSLVWSPYQTIHEQRIESVQKQFLLYALRKLNWSTNPLPSYEARCKLIDLEPLQHRREFFHISFVNDIMSQRVSSAELLWKLNFRAPSRPLMSRHQIFSIKFYRTDYAKFQPINKMMSIYNKYCNIVDLTMSRQQLKKSLKDEAIRRINSNTTTM